MSREELEHILRACKGTTGESEFIVVGSQSILGRFPDAPRDFLNGNLGELSHFHQTHQIWVDGVSPETATLPTGWETRLVRVENENTNGAIGWCLDPHDLAYAKLAARREKDLAFVANLIWHKLVRPSQIERAIESADTPLRERLSEAWTICRARAAKL